MTTVLILQGQSSPPFLNIMAPPKFEPPSFILSSVGLVERNVQLVISQVRKCVLDRGPGAKTIWGRSILEVLPSINGRLVRLHGFTPAETMLGFVPEWRVTHEDAQEVMSDITQGAMQEAAQGEIHEMERGPERLRIERMIGHREEQRALAVRSISENQTRQEGKTRAQWTQPRVGELVLVRDYERTNISVGS